MLTLIWSGICLAVIMPLVVHEWRDNIRMDRDGL